MPSIPDPALDTDGLIEFTRRLVRARSVNQPGPGGGEAAAVEVVLDQLDRFGWKRQVDEVAPGRSNVVVRLSSGIPGRVLMFEGHTDVVTEGDPELWTFDPFGGELVDGRVLGRGSADMKGGLAAMVFAARAIEEAGPFPGTIVLGILCDEEEMMIGVHDFVRRGHAGDVDGVIVCEPEAGEVCTVQKGALRIRVDIQGRMAHGAMPHEGVNPLTVAAALISRMSDLEAQLQRRHGAHPHLGLPYITPTHVAAGSIVQMNVIPATGLLTFDIRTIPGIDHPELVSAIEAISSEVTGDAGVEVTILVDRPATETPIDDPVVVAVAGAHQTVTGNEPVYGGVPGTTDGTILWRDAGLPVVVYGPGDKWIAHQADEFVEVTDLVSHAEVYIEAARRFLGG